MNAPWLTPRRTTAVLLALAACAYLYCFALVADFTCDDAGISFSYARSLAQGRGLALTAQAERTEGYSNLLWVLLLSFAIGNGAPPEAAAKAIAVLFGLGAVVLAGLLPSRFQQREPSGLDAVAAIVLATATPFVFWTAGGLENTLFAFLLLAAAWCFTGEAGRRDAFPASALMLFLASLTRPEGPVYAALCVPAIALSRPRPFWATLEWMAAFALPYGAFLGWRLAYFGMVLPPVFDVKMGGGWSERISLAGPGATYLAEWFQASWPWYAGLLAMTGLLSLARGRRGAWVVGSCAASIFFVLASGGDWMQHGRFLTPLLPFAAMGLAEGLRSFVRFLYSPDPARPALDAPTMAAAVSIALVTLRLAVPSAHELAATRGQYRVTFASRQARGEAYRELARSAGLREASLADPDIGGTSWASGLEIVDLAGIADRTLSKFGQSAAVRDMYLFEHRKPTFVRLHGVWSWATGLSGSRNLTADYVKLPPLPADQPGDENWVRRDILRAGPAEEPELSVEASYRGEVTLVGMTRSSALAAPGSKVEIALYWRRGAPSPGVHTVALELLDAQGVGVSRPLLHGWLPADEWKPDETMRQTIPVELPDSLPEGNYTIGVKLTSADGRELSASQAFPAAAKVVVSRIESRKRCREIAAALSSAEKAPAGADGLRRAVRELELTGVSMPHELAVARRDAAKEAARRAEKHLPTAAVWPEAAGYLKLAREWGEAVPETELKLRAALLEHARVQAARDNLHDALRSAALAISVDAADLEAHALRDALWRLLAERSSPAVIASALQTPN